MLLSCGRLKEALELNEALVYRSKVGETGDARVQGELAHQDSVLSGLEIECINTGGVDVGCGLGVTGTERFSQQLRLTREQFLKEFLASALARVCANCAALPCDIRKDGHNKIFLKKLSPRASAKMEEEGVRYRSALSILQARDAARQRRKSGKKGVGMDLDDLGVEEGFSPSEAASSDLVFGGRLEGAGDVYLPVSEVRAQMQLLWEAEAPLLRRLFTPSASLHYRAQKNVSGGGGLSEPTDGWKAFFLRVIPVPPSRFRPAQVMMGNKYEHPQNIYLSNILKLSDKMQAIGAGEALYSAAAAAVHQGEQGQKSDKSSSSNLGSAPPSPSSSSMFPFSSSSSAVLGGGTSSGVPLPPIKARVMFGNVDVKALTAAEMELSNTVNGYLDSTKMTVRGGGLATPGLRQLLEKKAGLFRQNLMAKRVNFCARTVISPDPNLRVDQVGVPLRFAQKLTYVTPVTSFNLHKLRTAVMRGPSEWPGATKFEDMSGNIIDLSRMSREERESVARRMHVGGDEEGAGDVDMDLPAAYATFAEDDLLNKAPTKSSLVGVRRVWRHLEDGDIVLMNRQPSLHKASIMAHVVKVMKAWPTQDIFRFHYANCKSYNADFDGDEMNLHFPQDELARAEAYGIVGTAHQYLSATAGTPLRGLIMDHNAISAVLTARDRLFKKDTFMQLLNAALSALPGFTSTSATLVGPSSASGKVKPSSLSSQKLTSGGVSLFSPGMGTPSHPTPSSTAMGAFSAVHTSSSSSSSSSSAFNSQGRCLDIVVPQPAILLPTPLWTGKQVISCLLRALSSHLPLGLFLSAKAKVKDELWSTPNGPRPLPGWRDVLPVGDAQVTIRDGYLLTGVLDKNSLGNTSFGLVHSVAEVLGPEAAGQLLSSMGLLLTTYLHMHAQTCGMGDFILSPAAERARLELLAIGQAKGLAAIASACGVNQPPVDLTTLPSSEAKKKEEEEGEEAGGVGEEKKKKKRHTTQPSSPRVTLAQIRVAVRAKLRGGPAGSDTTGAAALDAAVFLDNTAKSVNNVNHGEVLKVCLPYGLSKNFPANQFALMVETGSKGSVLNFSMITVGLGQQELEGRRVPLSPLGKSLPCFPAFHASPRSGGYISDRFLTGLRPSDYFFHCAYLTPHANPLVECSEHTLLRICNPPPPPPPPPPPYFFRHERP